MANADLKKKLAEKAGQNLPTERPKTLADQIQAMIPQFARALPKHMDADRLARIATTMMRQNPSLGLCSGESFLGAMMNCAALGLEPGLIGHAYLVPFNNKRTGRKECQFIIGYMGMLDLARRSGRIISMQARPVYENDFFKLVYGLEEDINHIPWHCREDEIKTESGSFKGAYFVALLKDGGRVVNYMPKAEIEERRSRSMAANSGPWVSDYIAMALKTVVRATFKWLPVSIEIREQIEYRDESVRITPDEVMDLDWTAQDVSVEESKVGDPSLFADESNIVA